MPRARGWPIRKPSDSSVELAQQFSPPSFLPNLPTYLRRRRRRKMKKAPNKGPYTYSKLLIKFPTASRHDPQPINALLQQILRTFRSGEPINLLTHRIDHRITLASSPPSAHTTTSARSSAASSSASSSAGTRNLPTLRAVPNTKQHNREQRTEEGTQIHEPPGSSWGKQ